MLMLSTLVKEESCRIMGCWDTKGCSENVRGDRVVTESWLGLELSDSDTGYYCGNVSLTVYDELVLSISVRYL